MPDDQVSLPSAETIAEICRAHHVRQLDLFGSVASGEARPDSDVDVLYKLDGSKEASRLDTYFGLQAALEASFGRKVDLVHDGEFRNPYFKAAVERQRRRLYP